VDAVSLIIASFKDAVILTYKILIRVFLPMPSTGPSGINVVDTNSVEGILQKYPQK